MRAFDRVRRNSWKGRRVGGVVGGILGSAALATFVYLSVAAAGPPATPLTASSQVPATTATAAVQADAAPLSVQSRTADEYPDYTPDPARVSTDHAVQLANAITTAFPNLRLQEAVEMQYPDTTVTEIWLSPTQVGRAGTVSVFVFKNPGGVSPGGVVSAPPDAHAGTPRGGVDTVAIAGATVAYARERPDGSGSQLIAESANGMVVNVSSGILKPENAGNPPLDKAGTEALAKLVMGLVN